MYVKRQPVVIVSGTAAVRRRR